MPFLPPNQQRQSTEGKISQCYANTSLLLLLIHHQHGFCCKLYKRELAAYVKMLSAVVICGIATANIETLGMQAQPQIRSGN